jgi:hypothetical protein
MFLLYHSVIPMKFIKKGVIKERILILFPLACLVHSMLKCLVFAFQNQSHGGVVELHSEIMMFILLLNDDDF